MKKILPVLFLLATSISFGQILTFEFDGIGGSEATVNSNTNDANLASSTISRGSGLSGQNNQDRFNSKNWSLNTLDLTDYLSFTVSPNAGYQVSITSIEIKHERSSQGPTSFALRSSIDGFSTDLGTFTSPNTNLLQDVINLNISNQASAIEFRIYGFSAGNDIGTWGPGDNAGNDIIVSGSVTCIAPSIQATTFSATNLGANTMDISFTRGNGDGGVLVLAKAGSAVDAAPTEGVSYTANAAFGSGDEVGSGNFVVFNGLANGTNAGTGNINLSSLSETTTYHFAIFEYNAIVPCYNLSALTGTGTTICATPTNVTMLSALGKNNEATIQWTDPSCFDEVLVIASTATITGTPSGSGLGYSANAAYGSGSDGQGDFTSPEFPVFKGGGNAFTLTSLTNFTTYFVKVFTRTGTSWSSGVEVMVTPDGLLFIEDFDDNTGTVATNFTNGQCNDGAEDYFGIVCQNGEGCGNEIGSSTNFSGGDGGSFLGAQDTNAEAACNSSSSVNVTFEDIDVSTASALFLCYEIAEDESTDGNQDWDGNSSVAFQIDFDNAGSFGSIIQISDALGGNSVPGIDNNCDGSGTGAMITSTFTGYCVGINGTGTSADLRVAIDNLNDGDEDVAIDNIRLYASNMALPATQISSTCPRGEANLPVELVSFEAQLIEEQVHLEWQTANEVNNSHFAIERSTDGIDFEAIGFLNGQGTIHIPMYYAFIDEHPNPGINYYRLKQIDFDGNFEHHPVRSIFYRAAGNQQLLVYPNPAFSDLQISLPRSWDTDLEVFIYDQAGRQVLQQNLSNTKQTLTIDYLQSGIYTVKATNARSTLSQRFFKQ